MLCLLLDAYISMETVVVDESGSVSFRSVAEDLELTLVYLAPELKQRGIVTEKVRPTEINNIDSIITLGDLNQNPIKCGANMRSNSH